MLIYQIGLLGVQLHGLLIFGQDAKGHYASVFATKRHAVHKVLRPVTALIDCTGLIIGVFASALSLALRKLRGSERGYAAHASTYSFMKVGSDTTVSPPVFVLRRTPPGLISSTYQRMSRASTVSYSFSLYHCRSG